jgi:hypothetical protein
MASVVVRGFVLGFVIAASPGAIFFLCLRRTLARGWLTGLVSGYPPEGDLVGGLGRAHAEGRAVRRLVSEDQRRVIR